MKILVTGATGFVGRALCKTLIEGGHHLVVVSRDPSRAKWRAPAPHTVLAWDFSETPTSSRSEEIRSQIGGLDAVIHLAGESLFGHRWTDSYKEKLRLSRVESSKRLISLLDSLATHPKVFITASAIGYYGDRGEEVLRETSPPGKDFLAKLCKDWEGALLQASLSGTRRVALRFGIVLGKSGGALDRMLPIFSFGLGGSLGSGKQWMSWIHIDDLVSIITRCLGDEALSGPINCVAPYPVTNSEFSTTFAKTLHRPTFLKIPKFMLKFGLGEASQALLSSQRVAPAKLIGENFRFKYPNLKSALEAILSN